MVTVIIKVFIFFFNLFNIIFFIGVTYGYVTIITRSFNVILNDVFIFLILKVFYNLNVAVI